MSMTPEMKDRRDALVATVTGEQTPLEAARTEVEDLRRVLQDLCVFALQDHRYQRGDDVWRVLVDEGLALTIHRPRREEGRVMTDVDKATDAAAEREELIKRVKRLRKQFTGASRSVNAERAEKKKVQARVSALQIEAERLRADLIEERRTVTRLLDDHRRACVRAEQAEERYKKLLQDMRDLVGGSGGVCGLHSNGDPAPWDELVDLGWLPQEVLDDDD